MLQQKTWHVLCCNRRHVLCCYRRHLFCCSRRHLCCCNRSPREALCQGVPGVEISWKFRLREELDIGKSSQLIHEQLLFPSFPIPGWTFPGNSDWGKRANELRPQSAFPGHSHWGTRKRNLVQEKSPGNIPFGKNTSGLFCLPKHCWV